MLAFKFNAKFISSSIHSLFTFHQIFVIDLTLHLIIIQTNRGMTHTNHKTILFDRVTITTKIILIIENTMVCICLILRCCGTFKFSPHVEIVYKQYVVERVKLGSWRWFILLPVWITPNNHLFLTTNYLFFTSNEI